MTVYSTEWQQCSLSGLRARLVLPVLQLKISVKNGCRYIRSISAFSVQYLWTLKYFILWCTCERIQTKTIQSNNRTSPIIRTRNIQRRWIPPNSAFAAELNITQPRFSERVLYYHLDQWLEFNAWDLHHARVTTGVGLSVPTVSVLFTVLLRLVRWNFSTQPPH